MSKKETVRSISADIPESHCWCCAVPLQMAGSAEPDQYQTPEPGSWSICIVCGAPATFDEALRLVKPSNEEMAEFLKSEDYREFLGRDYVFYVFPEGMRKKGERIKNDN